MHQDSSHSSSVAKRARLTRPLENKQRERVRRMLTGSLLLAGLWWVSTDAKAAVEFGQPSVQSQQGQRLRVAIPYSKTPGEPVSINRFSVDTVTLADGRVLDGKRFLLMAPLHRNMVIVQSPDNVYSPVVKLAMKISNQTPAAASFDLALPPFRAAASEAAEVTAKKSPPKRKSVKKKQGQRSMPKAMKKATPSVSLVPVPEGSGAGTKPLFAAPTTGASAPHVSPATPASKAAPTAKPLTPANQPGK